MLAVLAVSRIMPVTCKCMFCFHGVPVKIILLSLGPVRGRDAVAPTRSIRLTGTRGVSQRNRLFLPLGESLPLPAK